MNRNLFPLEFQKALVLRESSYAMLTKAMGRRGYRVTKQFLGMIGLGQRSVPPGLLARICETLELDEVAKRRLNRAAALDIGFDVGPIDG